MVGVISALLSQGQLQANPITAPEPIIIGAQTSRKKFWRAAARPRDGFCIFLITLANKRLTGTALSSQAIHESRWPLTSF